MRSVKQLLGPAWPALCFILLAFLILSASRIGLVIWQWPRVSETGGLGFILLQGLRFDLATLSWLWGVPLMFSMLLLGNGWIGRLWGFILRIWLTLGLWLLVLFEITTGPFMTEYGLRPNRTYVEYLIYPKEVFGMLWNGRPLDIVLVLVVSLLVLIGGGWLSGRLLRDLRPIRWYTRPFWSVLILVLGVLSARSTLGHRPLNSSMAAFSTDPLVNDLAINSAYTLFEAIGQMDDEVSAFKLYGKMPEDEIIYRIRQFSGRSDSDFNHAPANEPTLTPNSASYQGKPKNLVIILEESLGARFIGTLGGLPLSPHFDQLAKQGWLFDNIYATGTRSVRGIEAVVTGFTPTPSRSVVKLGKSQTGFFTLAQLLKSRGYMTQFIYGGESHFDNMRGFFFGNGFQSIIDQNDYQNPTFVGSWGVSDEDLLSRANQEFEKFHQQGKPFFSLVFSSSNHDPFEFPDGRIKLYEQPKQTRNNAAKYADYAIGSFFSKAKKSDYYKDTLFLIIADHDSRARGDQLVPISRFHIPALILGEGIKPKRDERITSQIDMPPTLLSLMGIPANYPMVGRDLTRTPADWPGRALMQFSNNFALMQGNNVVVLQPGKAPVGFVYDKKSNRLTPTPQPLEMQQEAKAIALWGDMAYQKELYGINSIGKRVPQISNHAELSGYTGGAEHNG